MADFEMNVTYTVDLRGLQQAGIEEKLQQVVFIAARNVETRAKQVVPVDTGKTKNSIFVDPGSPALQQRVGPTTDYAPFIEFGTRYWEGKAFMIPALEAEAGPMQSALAQVFEKLGR